MEFPRQDSADNSTSPKGGFPKIQIALNRVNSLTDKLSQTQYPSQYVDLYSKPRLTINKKTFLVKGITLLFLLVAIHTRLKDNEFTSYRLLWNLLGLSFFLISSQVSKSIKTQISIFYAVRILCSSLLYSFVSNRSLSYDFHLQSHEYDILIETMYSLLTLLCYYKEHPQLKSYFIIGFIGNLVITAYLQHSFNVFDVSPYFFQVSTGLFIFVFCFMLVLKGNQEKAMMESSVIEHCKEISKELMEIHQDLKEEENNLLQARTPTSSVADEILTKIKYFKFKMLQEEKEKRFLNTKNSVFRPSKMNRGTSSLALSSERREEKSVPPQMQRRLSYNTEERADIDNLLTSEKAEETNYAKWKLSPKDCDILIKMMLEKQVTMYYPNVLKETNNQINHETAEFLKQHFTEIGNSLLSPGIDRKNKHFNLNETQAFTYSPWNEYLESNICTWNFDMLKFKDLTNGRHFLEFGNALMKRFNILKTLDTSQNVATNFLKDVSEGYLPNPYHNSIHGADVANSTGYFLSHQEFGGHFTELEASCLIVAALVHDVGHPGFNNAFLIATKSTEALLYNDQSVLENLHSAYFFKILQKPYSNILQNLNEKDYKYFRKLSIALILDTDLTKHFVILTKFKGIADQPNLIEEENKFLSLSIALKCADIGHGAKELSLHKKWSRRIIEEFYLQGDKEREHGIPVSPLCERSGGVSNSQQGFISFVCLPLLEAFDKKFFNQKMRKEVTDQVKLNLEYWKEEIPKEEKGESKFMEETAKILDDIKSELPASK